MNDSNDKNLEKFSLIWEALLEKDKKRFIDMVFQSQSEKSQKAMIELAATIGVDRIYENLNKNKDQKDKRVE